MRVKLLREYRDGDTVHAAGETIEADDLPALQRLMDQGCIARGSVPGMTAAPKVDEADPLAGIPTIQARVLKPGLVLGLRAYNVGEVADVELAKVRELVKHGFIASEHAPDVEPTRPRPVPNGGPTQRIRFLVGNGSAPIPGVDSSRVGIPRGAVVETTAAFAAGLIGRKEAEEVDAKTKLTNFSGDAEPAASRPRKGA